MLFAVLKIKRIMCFSVLAIAIIGIPLSLFIEKNSHPVKGEPIKWIDFNVSTVCLDDAMRLDIETNADDYPISWIDTISYLACIYGNDFSKYSKKDMDSFKEKIKSGNTIEEITKDMKYFNYYQTAHRAVLGEFLGDYEVNSDDTGGECKKSMNYGLKVFSPIAKGYAYNHYNDFGSQRSYGYKRKHLGNDLMGSVGTPIIAVEGGYIEAIGWNRYGGWRIGIRSFDKKRYYYYAHLRKNTPYAKEFKVGERVNAGDTIGYLGMTGYSLKENVNNIDIPHLHFGINIIFDESQKDSKNEIWIDVYDIVNILSKNRADVKVNNH